MTIDIAAIRKRAEAATAGRWWPRYGGEPGEVYASAAKRHVATTHEGGGDEREHPDATFIAAARSDVPALCDRVEALEKALRDVAARMPDGTPCWCLDDRDPHPDDVAGHADYCADARAALEGK